MSLRIMTAVWEQSPQDGSVLLILLALADMANDDGECWPSIARLAQKGRISERSVQRILRQLEESKEIRVEEGAGPKTAHGRVNLYRVKYPRDGVTTVSPGDKADTRGVTRLSLRGDNSVTQNHQEPSVESTPPPPTHGGDVNGSSGETEPEPSSQHPSGESIRGGEGNETLTPRHANIEGSCEVDTKPPSIRPKRRGSAQDVDAKELLIAYRQVRFPGGPAFTNTDWRSYGVALRDGVADGRTPNEMKTATSVAMAEWPKLEMVNPRSVLAKIENLLERAGKMRLIPPGGQSATETPTDASTGQITRFLDGSVWRSERTHVDETLPCDCGKAEGERVTHRVYCSCMVLGKYQGHLNHVQIGQFAEGSGKSYLYEAAMAGIPKEEALEMQAQYEAWCKEKDDG